MGRTATQHGPACLLEHADLLTKMDGLVRYIWVGLLTRMGQPTNWYGMTYKLEWVGLLTGMEQPANSNGLAC
jgi:hypothetical protein